MEPSSIDIKVPILRTTKVPIELQTENQLPENYEITEVSINPSNVEIKGKKDILNITNIQTKPIDINSLIEDTELEVELKLPEGVELVNPNEKIVVSLKVEESMVETFTYTLDELKIENLHEDLFIDEEDYLKEIEIKLKGNKKVMEELTKEDLQLYLDLENATEGLNYIYIKYDVPTEIRVKEILPQPIELNLHEN